MGLNAVYPKAIPRSAWPRSIIAGLLLALVPFMTSLFMKELSVEFELASPPGTHTELFFAFGDRPFDVQHRTDWRARSGAWRETIWTYRGIHRVTRVRIDPMMSTGNFELGTIRLSGPRADHILAGKRLEAAIAELHQIQIIKTTPTTLSMLSTGADPQIVLHIPGELYTPNLHSVLPHTILLFIVGMMLWAIVETAMHFSRARSLQGDGKPRAPPPQWGIAIVFTIGLTYIAAGQINHVPLTGDAVHNLQIAHNIATKHVFSHQRSDTPTPTNFREPLPPLLIGAHLKLMDALGLYSSSASNPHVAHARLAKLSNLFWVFFGLLGSWLITYALTNKTVVALFATTFVFFVFFNHPTWINTLYTEVAMAAMIVWASYILLLAVRHGHVWLYFVSGLFLGILTLTKAAFFYIAPVAIVLVSTILLFQKKRPPGAKKVLVLILPSLVLGFAVIMAPWTIRNLALFDSPEISQRGGFILFGRATLNAMSMEEMMGGFYLYGPSMYKARVDGTRFGPIGDDFERGGRWQRLHRDRSSFAGDDVLAQRRGSPEDAISFHRTAGAILVRTVRDAQEAGAPDPLRAAETQLREEALTMLAENPLRHVGMSGLFLWRGFWSFTPVDIPGVGFEQSRYISEILNLISGTVLMGVFVIGVFRRNPEWVVITILPIGLLAFHAFLTHGLPRYSAPAQPVMIIALFFILHELWKQAFALRQRRRARTEMQRPVAESG